MQKNFILPESLECISRQAFAFSTMKSVTISKMVHTIDYHAFYKCTKLTDIYYEGSKSEWDKISVKYGNDALNNATIHFNCAPVYEISLEEQSLKLFTGETQKLNTNIIPNYTTDSIIWKSSNNEVVLVDKGTLTAVSAGTSVVSAQTEDGSLNITCNVTVIPRPEINSIIVNDLTPYGIELLTVDIDIKNLTENSIIIAASFDNNKLIELKQISQDNLKTYFPKDRIHSIKVFVWDKNMQPLCDKKENFIN